MEKHRGHRAGVGAGVIWFIGWRFDYRLRQFNLVENHLGDCGLAVILRSIPAVMPNLA